MMNRATTIVTSITTTPAEKIAARLMSESAMAATVRPKVGNVQ